jgi:hypothetical protein
LFYYIRNYSTQFSNSECETVIQNAFNTWASVSQFTFTKTSNINLADIEISWEVNSNHGNCPDFFIFSLAHASIGIEQYTFPGYVHFYDIKPFSTDSTQLDLESIALHEIGHVLGLQHSSDTTSVMYSLISYGSNAVKRDVTSSDIISLNSIYGFPYFIDGPRLINTYGQYRIDDLPSGFDVTWSVSNSYYNNNTHLIPNSPALGWCLVFRDDSYDMKNDTLKAEIKYNGATVQTLKKVINAYDDFWGQYTSGNLSGEINYTHVFGVKDNYVTTVTSPNFYNATVTYDSSGATPTAWGFDSSLGRLNFVVSASPPGNLIPVVINVHDGCGNDYVLYAFASTANSINVSYEENSFTVTLIGDGDSDWGSTFDQPWTIEVRNATTGALMATRSSTSRSSTISTIGWPKGIYIVKVTIGKEVLTEKVIVK